MQKFEFTVTDPNGIHARPAGLFVKEAQKLSSEIVVACHGKTADGKKLFSLMSLGAKNGETLSISVSGINEREDAAVLYRFLQGTL
jgi:phosphocarrier protein